MEKITKLLVTDNEINERVLIFFVFCAVFLCRFIRLSVCEFCCLSFVFFLGGGNLEGPLQLH